MDSNKNIVQLFKSLLFSSKATILNHRHARKHTDDELRRQEHHDATLPNDQVVIGATSQIYSDEIDNHEVCLQNLPLECKLAIFSYLSASEKVRCQRVCTEWRSIVKSRCLWKRIDFSEVIRPFNANTLTVDDRKPALTEVEKTRAELEMYYERERTSMIGYFKFLSQMRLSPSQLFMCLDIGDIQDQWLVTIRTFLENIDTRNLRRACVNWKETPWKPYSDSFYTWSNSNYSDLIYKHRRRQRQFVPFFDNFTAQATNLEYLSLPFDWSAASVTHLCRLAGSLKELVLTEYFVPQSFDQSLLDKILSSLTKLEKLTINIVFGSGLGLVGYQFNSQSLKYLNLSKCKGIAISKVNMPRLEVLISGNDTFLSHYLAGSDDNLIRREETPPLQRMCHSLSSVPPLTGSSSSLTSPPAFQHRRLQKSPSPLSSSLPESSFLSSPTINRFKMPEPLILNSKISSSSSSENATSESFSEVFLTTSSLPCIISVLKNGAPHLKQLNNYHFTGDRWPSFIDSALNKVLLETCSCKLHSSRTLSKIICS